MRKTNRHLDADHVSEWTHLKRLGMDGGVRVTIEMLAINCYVHAYPFKLLILYFLVKVFAKTVLLI